MGPTHLVEITMAVAEPAESPPASDAMVLFFESTEEDIVCTCISYMPLSEPEVVLGATSDHESVLLLCSSINCILARSP